jgi:hypothetical protein
MPDAQGMMNDAELGRAMALLGPRFSDKKCPVCSTDKWSVEPFLMKVDSLCPPDAVGYSYTIYISVICRHCSYTMFFNAISMGVVAHAPFPNEAEVNVVERTGVLSGDQ